MLGYTSGHRWRDAQRLVNAAEIIMHEVKGNSVLRFSTFFENAFVNQVNRRIAMRIVKFWRSTKLVETCFMAGLPVMTDFAVPMHSAGL
jgi:hypothetical protein